MDAHFATILALYGLYLESIWEKCPAEKAIITEAAEALLQDSYTSEVHKIRIAHNNMVRVLEESHILQHFEENDSNGSEMLMYMRNYMKQFEAITLEHSTMLMIVLIYGMCQ